MSNRRLPKAQTADQILSYYIILALQQAGVSVNSDTKEELGGLIEEVINEAVDVAVREALAAIPPSVLE